MSTASGPALSPGPACETGELRGAAFVAAGLLTSPESLDPSRGEGRRGFPHARHEPRDPPGPTVTEPDVPRVDVRDRVAHGGLRCVEEVGQLGEVIQVAHPSIGSPVEEDARQVVLKVGRPSPCALALMMVAELTPGVGQCLTRLDRIERLLLDCVGGAASVDSLQAADGSS